MPDHQFRTTIEVDVPVERAWDVLVDFGAYGEWCPTHREIRGVATVGTKLRLRLAGEPGSDKTLAVSAKVRRADPPHLLAFGGGIPGAAWLFDIHHAFRLEPLSGGRCRLHNEERFRGMLLALLWSKIAPRVERGYPAFNAAFKRRCEETARSPK
jgi:hypothetical protein